METLTRLTWFNRLALAIVAVATGLLLTSGRPLTAVSVGLAIPILLVVIWRSQRGLGSDADRANAAQPYDERDRALGRFGFAIVGQVAILAQLAVALWALVYRPVAIPSEMTKLVALALVWAAANEWAARRA